MGLSSGVRVFLILFICFVFTYFIDNYGGFWYNIDNKRSEVETNMEILVKDEVVTSVGSAGDAWFSGLSLVGAVLVVVLVVVL